MDRIVVPDERRAMTEDNLNRARETLNRPTRQSFLAPAEAADTTRSETPLVDPPAPPFWGVRELTDFTYADMWPHLDLKTLFRLHWGGKGVKDEAWEKLQEEEFLPRLAAMERDAEESGWLMPRALQAFFPANADKNDLVIFDPVEQDREIARFFFPRQPARERLCLADYFLPVDDGRKDVVSFQIVTMGENATKRSEETQARGDYSESYFTHGLSVSSAEALAEYVHQRTRAELGIGPETGKRYSWGYPSCPDLSQHAIVDKLLDFSQIGVELTEGFQFMPEQTTAAIVIPHPDAKYFALLRTGGDPAATTGEVAAGVA
jgi:5-methyltetrahydrofolate--homocysteine methyltransferase